MSNWHGYLGVFRELTLISNTTWNNIVQVFDVLNGTTDNASTKMQKRTRPDNRAVTYEANFYTAEITPTQIKNAIAAKLGISSILVTYVQVTVKILFIDTTITTFTISAIPSFKYYMFARETDSSLPDWQNSMDETNKYIADNSGEWN